MIRTILVLLSVLLFLVGGLPLLLFEYLLGKRNPALRDRQCRLIIRTVFRWILFLSGTELTLEGTEHIPEGEAVLYVGNHRSFFDILTTYQAVKGKTGYVAKKEIGKIPLLRQWMELIGCLFLDRGDVKAGLRTILKAIEDVKAGTSLVIYPEGTRNRNPDPLSLLEFKEGSLKIAEKSGCRVIPFAEYGSDNIFEKHIPFIRKSKVVIRYGEAIDLKQLPEAYKRKAGLYLKETVEALLRELKEDYPEIP